ncbi:uncharacterized protein [Miscanthus floridulus]|uniref:uncharacterized protein n=1 Tax=Miscanthus floridulus TaxID=154761 RepID=UPI003459882F
MPPPPPSCPAAPPRPDNLMPDLSTAPPRIDAAADPSPSSEPQGTPPRSADRESSTECSAPEDSSDDFVLDSGAAVHATARADLLSDPKPPDEGTIVRTRVGGILPVLAVGCVRRPRFMVPQVHHARQLKNGCTAVISVRQLARQGLVITFGSDSCSVKEQSTGALVGEGRLREEDGFYHLGYLRVPQS